MGHGQKRHAAKGRPQHPPPPQESVKGKLRPSNSQAQSPDCCSINQADENASSSFLSGKNNCPVWVATQALSHHPTCLQANHMQTVWPPELCVSMEAGWEPDDLGVPKVRARVMPTFVLRLSLPTAWVGCVFLSNDTDSGNCFPTHLQLSQKVLI